MPQKQLRLPFINPTDQFELEKIAQWARQRAGFSPTDAPFGVDLINALCGSKAYAEDPNLPKRGLLLRRDGFCRIMQRPKEPDGNFVATQKLAHHLLLVWGYPKHSPKTERFANYLAAALLVTREALLGRYRKVGENLLMLSATFDTSQSLIHRRLAELLGDIRGIFRGTASAGSIDIFNFDSMTDRQLHLLETRPHSVIKRAPMNGTAYDVGRVAFRIVA